MARCKHADVRCLYLHGPAEISRGLWSGCECDIHRANADALVCRTCGAWLPLGPSNDDPIEVSTEIRAAMHLAEANHQLGWSSTWEEALGVAAFDMDNDPPSGDLAWLWHAGWLTRAAWTTCAVCGFESPVPCRHTAADSEGVG